MKKDIYDVIIIGGGPAGLSAAIYMARAQFSVLVIEKDTIGGQITITSEVVNYPGIVKTSGKELTEQMRIQAQNFGAEFKIAEVNDLSLNKKIKTIKTDKGTYQSVGVILATGASPRMIGFTGEKEFRGRGVAYCATCDGEFFSGLDVFVIGGGFAAAEEAIFLTKYASKVTMIVREPDFTCAKSIADEVKSHPNIDIHYNTEILSASGDAQLKKAIFRNNETKKEWQHEAQDNKTFGIFVFAGYEPATALFKTQVSTNEQGYLVTDVNQKTSLDGVYGAGDVCIKNLRQVTTAVSDGAIASTSLEKYIPGVVDQLNLTTRSISAPINSTSTETSEEASDSIFISNDMKKQLIPILEKFTHKAILKCFIMDDELSKEIVEFTKEFTSLSDKLSYETVMIEQGEPAISLFDENNKDLRIKYHAVPGGHEFNSFVIALYNAIGPKQTIEETILDKIKKIEKPKNIKVMVSLSCTMCPDVVMATQRVAIENENITAEMYDLSHFPKIKEKYNIMSVPCMIIDDKEIYFGKKDLQEVTDILSI
ncbi:thioredoxin reductase (NADPH) [Breznakia sp. PF5-3]|uniref:FAD-dependent oxidoreductase n=1 Tax=unclassified Breznakia TaxID=2623764 RepID=UPI002406B9FD|nr:MULTISPECIES: FAD-dependent oxidoreductase [unclassified Breznakia]MDF9825128.1 thioredoxin reductase (NADPH) [Breznakia sp. PM6-1]MDF9836013.1 thioredoxin reductase (NADPH) [Breznakia sp. PF5-3]MDF9838111.1 thioredoxin reductase (NADPH) [Breznakia sp. PFB2-8]MDF9860059.1 thioredoxin reductase (NADPH) [Breznakia sp. PH5-24]